MMTREELIEWMGDSRDYHRSEVNVVVNCATMAEAQEVADAITDIMGGVGFDVHDYEDQWWKWIWLNTDATDEIGNLTYIDAYGSNATASFVAKEYGTHTQFITGEEALSIMLNGRYGAPTRVEDLI